MQTGIFDTHANVKKLLSVGFTEEQAEAHTKILGELVKDQLATKKDILELELSLERLKYDLTIRMGGMLVVNIVIIAVMLRLVNL